MNNKTTTMLRMYAPSVLRYALSLVILWFGLQQVTHTADWTAYVPESVAAMLHVSALTLVMFNGIFELVFGILLIVGIQTRWVALLLALHLLDIMYTVGYGEIGVRDFGLAIATFSIFMYGPDVLSIQNNLYYSNGTNTK